MNQTASKALALRWIAPAFWYCGGLRQRMSEVRTMMVRVGSESPPPSLQMTLLRLNLTTIRIYLNTRRKIMISSRNEIGPMIPLLTHTKPCSPNVNRWSSLLGTIFGVFLHLSLLGVNAMYWWSSASLELEPQAEMMRSIAWTFVWAFVISSLSALFLYSLSKLASSFCSEASLEYLLNIESRFVVGCLCSLVVLECVYTAFQLSFAGGNHNLFLFCAVICSIGIGGAVHIRSFKSTAAHEEGTEEYLSA